MGIVANIWDKVIPVILRGETPYKLTLGRQAVADLFGAYYQPVTTISHDGLEIRVAGADLLVEVDPYAPVDQIYVWIKLPEPELREKIDLAMSPEYKKLANGLD